MFLYVTFIKRFVFEVMVIAEITIITSKVQCYINNKEESVDNKVLDW